MNKANVVLAGNEIPAGNNQATMLEYSEANFNKLIRENVSLKNEKIALLDKLSDFQGKLIDHYLKNKEADFSPLHIAV